MKLFKKIFGKKDEERFFEEEPVDARFNMLANFARGIDTKAEANRALEAMEHILIARQKLAGIRTDDDEVDGANKFMLHEKEDG